MSRPLVEFLMHAMILKIFKHPVVSTVVGGLILAFFLWLLKPLPILQDIQEYGMKTAQVPYWFLTTISVLTIVSIYLAVRGKLRYASVKAWEQRKHRYKLHKPFESGVVYALKESMSGGDVPHYACTVCFEKSKVSILDSKMIQGQKAVLVCPVCNTEVQSLYNVLLDPEFPPE